MPHASATTSFARTFSGSGCDGRLAEAVRCVGGLGSVAQDDAQEERWAPSSRPSYSMNPSCRNVFMKNFTRERVVPIIAASVSWDTRGSVR